MLMHIQIQTSLICSALSIINQVFVNMQEPIYRVFVFFCPLVYLLFSVPLIVNYWHCLSIQVSISSKGSPPTLSFFFRSNLTINIFRLLFFHINFRCCLSDSTEVICWAFNWNCIGSTYVLIFSHSSFLHLWIEHLKSFPFYLKYILILIL